jgi:hypothetical protein
MNHFVRHHRQSIQFGYSCFDRIVSGMIQPLQAGYNVRNFLVERGQAVNHKSLVAISSDYHRWVKQEAATQGIEILTVEKDVRREDLVRPYFERLAGQPGLAVILHCREPEGTPVIRTCLDRTSMKQYVRDHRLLRSEVTTGQLHSLHLPSRIDSLLKVRTLFAASIERYHNAQQDILETYVGHGTLHTQWLHRRTKSTTADVLPVAPHILSRGRLGHALRRHPAGDCATWSGGGRLGESPQRAGFPMYRKYRNEPIHLHATPTAIPTTVSARRSSG